MATTSRLAIPYPAGTDLDDVPNWMNQMAVRLDAIIAPASHGPLASRPVSTVGTPGIADRLYFATDVDPKTIADAAGVNGVLYRDTGTGWQAIGPNASKVTAGIFTPPGVTGTFDVTGLGFQAKFVEILGNLNDNVDTNTTIIQGWATSSTNRMAMFNRASGTGGGLYQRRIFTNRCIFACDNNGTTVMSADYVSGLPDGFRLNFTVVPGSPTGYTLTWKAWG